MIFGYLTFRDLIPSLHTCHYWRSCGLREQPRYPLCNVSSHSPAVWMKLMRSPLRYHFHLLDNFTIYHLSPDFIHFTHLTQITFLLNPPRVFISKRQSPPPLLHQCRLPHSLTRVTIEARSDTKPNDIIQSFLDILPTGTNIAHLDFTTHRQFDLSPLLQMHSLTDLTLSELASQRLPLKGLTVISRLSLKRCWLVWTPIDLTIFHAQSTFMLNIEDWNWSKWMPNEQEWKRLIQSPPPKLHSLQLWSEPQSPPIGLEAFKLRSLYLQLRSFSTPTHPYLSHILPLQTLTHLRLECEFAFSDDELCQILNALTNVTLFQLFTTPSPQLSYNLRLLPPDTIMQSVKVISIDSFSSNLIQNERSERLEIHYVHLLDRSECGLKSFYRPTLLQLCQSMTHLCDMRIYYINLNRIDFRYSKPMEPVMPSKSHAVVIEEEPVTLESPINSPGVDPPAEITAARAIETELDFSPTAAVPSSEVVPSPRLVGIELNPGPQVQDPAITDRNQNVLTSIRTLQPAHTHTSVNLIKDGLHSIWSFTSRSDWLSSIRTCHHWHQSSLNSSLRKMYLRHRSLHGIFGFLSPREWAIAIRTSRLWLNSAKTEPSRRLDLTIHRASSADDFCDIPSLQSSMLHHISSIVQRGIDYSITFKEMDLILSKLPQVNSAYLDIRLHEDASPLQSIRVGMCKFMAIKFYHDPHPQIMNSNVVALQLFIQGLSMSQHIEWIILDSLSASSDLSPLNQCSKLSNMSLSFIEPCEFSDGILLFTALSTNSSLTHLNIRPFDRLFNLAVLPYVNLPKLRKFGSIGLLTLDQPGSLFLFHKALPAIEKLAPLQFWGADLYLLPQFLNLTEIEFGRRPLVCNEENELELLCQPLLECSLSKDLSLGFRTFTLSSASWQWLGSHPSYARITSLHFSMILHDDDCNQLSLNLISTILPLSDRLRTLEFSHVHLNLDDLYLLKQFQFCETLMLLYGFKKVWYHEIYPVLDDCDFLPRLRSLYLEQVTYNPDWDGEDEPTILDVDEGDFPDGFRVKPKIIPLQAPLLVVEPFPGYIMLSTRTSTAQTLFVDGILVIFGFLTFQDLVAGLKSCHYWHSCGLKERSRQLTFALSDYHRCRYFRNLIRSPFNFHVIKLIDLTIYQLLSIQQLELPNLQTLVCEFPPHFPESMSPIPTELPQFTLPKKLTNIKINFLRNHSIVDLCQSFIHLLATGSSITSIEFKNLTRYPVHHFDLSPLQGIPTLTHFELLQDSYNSSDLLTCASLPLAKLVFSYISSFDLMIFHPQSKLMLNLEVFDCSYWIPTQAEWQQLSTHPPPKLHTLTLKVTSSKPAVGLSALNLTTLILERDFDYKMGNVPLSVYLPTILNGCHTLTHLELSDIVLTDEALCQILLPLKRLDYFWYNDWNNGISQHHNFPAAALYFPRFVKFTRLPFESLMDMCPCLCQGTRLEELVIRELTVPQISLNDNAYQVALDQFCGSMSHQFTKLQIDRMNDQDIVFVYVRSTPPVHPPAKRLVGVELNPGPENPAPPPPTEPFLRTYPASSAQTLFVDGVLSIFGFLLFCDVSHAIETCHYWYLCGLKEKSRQLILDLTSRMGECISNVLVSPFRYHVGQIKNLSIYQFNLCQSFRNLHTIRCSFDEAVAGSSTVVPPSTSLFEFPESLTSLMINSTTTHVPPVGLCQRFISSLVGCKKLVRLHWTQNFHGYQFDLEPLLQIPSLNDLHLFRLDGFGLYDLNLCSHLTLKKFYMTILIESRSYDLTVYHPQSPFMLSIENWGWSEWKPTTKDWTHLSTYSPPKLRSLTLLTQDDRPPIGLASLHLEGLTVNISTGSVAYVPYISQCSSLKQLCLNGFISNENLRQILSTLVQLDQFKLMDHGYPFPFTTSLQHLPRHTILPWIQFESFQVFVTNLILSKRVECLEINDLDVMRNGRPIVGGFNQTVELIRTCQNMSQLKKMRIQRLNEKDGFYHHTPTSTESSQENKEAAFKYFKSLQSPPSKMRPFSPIQTFFVDGVLSILIYLSFADSLSATHSCRHWYSCSLKEKSRSMTVNMVTLTKNPFVESLWTSPHRYHISMLNNLSIQDFHLVQRFSHLRTCSCSGSFTSITNDYDPINNQPPARIPDSLTSLSILTTGMKQLTESDRKAYQQLIDILPTGVNLSQLELVFQLSHQLDLAPLKQMPSLTDLYLSLRYQYRPSAQSICAELPLKKFHFSGLTDVNFNHFHPRSKLMSTIEKWDWSDWKPTEAEWKSLSTNPPPHLRTLTIIFDPTRPMYGLSALNLTHLNLSLDVYEDMNYLPYLTQCRSLKQLYLKNVLRLDDTDLCTILQSLTNLDYFKLHNSKPVQLTRSLQLFPRRTVIGHLQIDSFSELTKYLIQSPRLEILELSLLGLAIQSINSDELIQLCESILQLSRLRIGLLNQKRLQFDYQRVVSGQSKKDVPASRLIGIEKNPGPTTIMTPPTNPLVIDQTAIVSSMVDPTQNDPIHDSTIVHPHGHLTSLSPQTLFNDGLQIIFSYLNQSDWVATLLVCHHWSTVSAGTPSRHLRFPINSDGSFVCAPSPRLVHHFIGLRPYGRKLIYLNQEQLLTIGSHLPRLEWIHCTLSQRHRPTTLDPTDMIKWPITLNHLSISFRDVLFNYPDLLRAISTCHTLTHLMLDDIHPGMNLSSFSVIADMNSLDTLFLGLGYGYEGYQPFDLLAAMHLSSLPASLTQLTVCYGDPAFFTISSIAHMRLPNLVELSLIQTTLVAGDLERLFLCAPNLVEIYPLIFYPPDFPLLSKFESLRRLSLTTASSDYETSYSYDEYESMVIPALCRCIHLTSLELDSWIPHRNDSWLQLSTNLVHLTHLSLRWVCKQCPPPSSSDVLLSFTQLRELIFLDADESIDCFSYSTIMPQLTYLRFGWQSFVWSMKDQINTDNYRVPLAITPPIETIGETPHAKDLTREGIEPGPIGSAPTTATPTVSVTPQTVFKDALHMIYSYLRQADFLSAIRSCHHWYVCAATSPSLHLSYSFGSLEAKPPSHLLHHITHLQSKESMLAEICIKQLFTASQIFPDIESFTADVNDFFAKAGPPLVEPLWPRGLKEINLSLNGHPFPTFIPSICTCTTLTRLSLLQISRRVDFRLFTHIQFIPVLESLTITLAVGSRINGIDVLQAMELKQLQPTLKYLNICLGSEMELSLERLAQMELPQLTEINLAHRRLSLEDVNCLARCAPNLRYCCPLDYETTAFGGLHQLKLIQEITIYDPPHIFQRTGYESLLVAGLCACPSLTSIVFGDWRPQRVDSWQQLALSLPHLSRLVLLWINGQTEIITRSLNVLGQFPQLTDLKFRDNSGVIEDYFRSPTVMPNLKRLSIGWDLVWEREASARMNYRVPLIPPHSDSGDTRVESDQHRSPSHHLPSVDLIKLEHNHLSAQVSIDAGDCVPDHAPADDLTREGVERNPGPTSFNPSTITGSLVILTPQTIFKDALHIIYSYLDLSDWLSSMYTCHHWYASGCSQPTRQLTWIARSSDLRIELPASSTPTSTRIPSLPYFNLRSHFTCVDQKDGVGFFSMPGDLYFRSISPFTHYLTRMMMRVDKDISNTNVAHWPPGLTELIIILTQHPFPHLLTSFIQQLPKQLQSLSIRRVRPGHLAVLGDHLQHLNHLTSLQLWGEFYTDLELFQSQRPFWSHLPASLTSLDAGLWNGTIYRFDDLPQLPQLRSMVIHELKEDDLDAILAVAPNLRQLSPTSGPFHLKHLSQVKLFESLDTISLRERPTHYPIDDHDCTVLITHLSECHSLTCLRFGDWVAFTSENWLRLSDAVPCLIHLELTSASGPSLNRALSPHIFMNLQYLSVSGDCSAELHATLNNPLICPNLINLWLGSYSQGEFFEFDVRDCNNPDGYRLERLPTDLVSTVSDAIPPPDLTMKGVEPNPGPFLTDDITPTTTVTPKAQTLFKDGLHHIYSYLPLHDWLNCMYTCHSWLNAGRTQPSRHLSCDFVGRLFGQTVVDQSTVVGDPKYSNECGSFFDTDVNSFVATGTTSHASHHRPFNSDLVPYYLRTLFTHLIIDASVDLSLSTNELCRRLDYFPSLTSISELSLKDEPDSDTRDHDQLHLPKRLAQISFNFRVISDDDVAPMIHVIASLSQQKTHQLTSLTISYLPSLLVSQLSVLSEFTVLQTLVISSTQETIPDFVLSGLTLPTSLTYLDLCSGKGKSLMSIHLLLSPLPSLTELVMTGLTLQRGDLTRVNSIAPNLQFLEPCYFYIGDSNHLRLFTSLHTLHFNPRWLTNDYVDILTSGFSTTPSLTKLILDNIHFDCWPQLATALPQLKGLEIRIIYSQSHSYLRSMLNPSTFLQLEELIVHNGMVNWIKDIMNNCDICPKLKYMRLEVGTPSLPFFEYDITNNLHTNDYRLSRSTNVSASEYPPPPKDLTKEGVEPNPGPSNLGRVSSSMPSPTASTLFVDGILTIFQFLALRDVLPALHSCHYWYQCGLKERSRQLQLELVNSNSNFVHSSSKISNSNFLNLLESPLNFHIGTITKCSLEHLLLIHHQSLPSQLNTLACSFSRFISSVPNIPKHFSESLQLPDSVTLLEIEISSLCTAVDLCQSFLDRILPTGTNIKRIKFKQYSLHDFNRFDLSPFILLPNLTDLHLDLTDGFTTADQQICAGLPLVKCHFIGLTQPDWVLFNPLSPFISHIRDWNWDHWRPTNEDWNSFLAIRPPQLDSLTISINTASPIQDLSKFNLTSLSLLTQSNYPEPEGDDGLSLRLIRTTPALTYLRLTDSMVTDQDLCRILISLKELDQLHLRHQRPSILIRSFHHLPRYVLTNDFHFDSIDHFFDCISPWQKLEQFEIDNLKVLSEFEAFLWIGMSQTLQLQEGCQTRMKQLEMMKIERMNQHRLQFEYHHSGTQPASNCNNKSPLLLNSTPDASTFLSKILSPLFHFSLK